MYHSMKKGCFSFTNELTDESTTCPNFSVSRNKIPPDETDPAKFFDGKTF